MYWPLVRGSGSASVNHRQRIPRDRVPSEGVLAVEADPNGAQDDPEVEKYRPVFDVVKVMFDPLLYLFDGVGLTSPAVHLSPAGDAGLHAMSGVVVFHRLLIEQ